MAGRQLVGYCTSRRVRLLKDFSRSAEAARAFLVKRYGVETTESLIQSATREFEALIPHIPRIPGIKGRSLSSFIVIAAQELAAYHAFRRKSLPADEAWDVCHEVLLRRVFQVPRWKRRLVSRIIFSATARKVFARRERSGVHANIGEFEIEYLGGAGRDYSLGVNYHQCAILNFYNRHDGGEFAPWACMSDIVLSDALGWGLRRSQTLAEGAPSCDFRFIQGAQTRVTSNNPRIQAFVERIAAGTTTHHLPTRNRPCATRSSLSS